MVQTVKSVLIFAGEKRIILEEPHTLRRIFFSVRVLAKPEIWFDTKMSFDDPLFHSYYSLNGPEKYFEAAGADIFQGNIWIFNASGTNLWFLATEILHNTS